MMYLFCEYKMNLVKFIFLWCITFLLFSNAIQAQNFTTKGKVFWVGFMENFFPNGEFHVYITSELNTTGVIEIPLQGWAQNFNVAPGITTDIIVPFNMAQTLGSGNIQNTGIRVTAQDSVTVFNLNLMPNTSDATVILPIQTVGNQYYVMAYRDNAAPFSDVTELLVLANFDNTQIEITPSVVGLNGQPAGVPFTIVLNAGQTYQLQANGDLTGTLVRAIDNGNGCPNFSLYGGNRCTGVQCAFCDHLNEQLYPTFTWGQDYVISPLRTRTSSRYRVLAQTAGTVVNINGGPNINLNAGQFFEFDLNASGFVTANNPVSVAQFSKGSSCDNTQSDPFMIMLSPTNQQLNNITFNAFSSNIINTYFLNVVTKTANTNRVLLDGANVGAQFSPVLTNNAWSFAQIIINQGDHTIQSDSGFVAYVYGYGTDDSYGYPVGANLTNVFADFTFSPADSTLDTTFICPNTLIRFKGVIDPTVSLTEWDFGDGFFATGQNTAHAYSTFGIYQVKMIISRFNACGKDTISKFIRVLGPEPNLITADTICAGTAITLNASITTGTYLWNTGATTSSITVAPDTTALFIVTIEDSLCRGAPDTTTIFVSNPKANFDFIEQCLGDTVFFNNTTTTGLDTITSFAWNFGDAATSTLTNPSHIYTSSGVFNVSLSVISELGCLADTIITLTNHAIPLANFSAANVCNQTEVDFINNSNISMGSISTYSWNFGDQNFDNTASPSHLYADTGTYVSMLIVNSDFGCADTFSQSVTVYPLPLADWSAMNQCLNLPIDYINNSVFPIGSNFNWDFGDGNNSNVVSPSHTFASAGTYTVGLVVTSPELCADTLIKEVVVFPRSLPDFSFSNVCEVEDVIFTNNTTLSSGSFGNVWDFGDGTSSIDFSPTHLYTNGTYSILLITTTDSNCIDSIRKDITVYLQPMADYNFVDACFRNDIVFTDNSSPNAGLSYNWNFDDGNFDSNPSTAHNYASAGTYEVQFTVVTTDNCSDSITKSITVYPQPVPDFSFQNACLNDANLFNNTTVLATGNIDQWIWDFGDGITAVTANTSHTYTTEGNFNVSLKAVSDFGCEDSISKTVTVYPLPTASTSSTIACFEENNALATVFPNEGTPGYNVLWSDDQTTEIANNLFAGTYSVTVFDANNCTFTTTETVNQQPFPVILQTNFAIDTIRFGDTINVVSVSGNYDPFLTYNWQPDIGLGCDTCQNTFAAPLVTTTYTITAFDTLGCVGETSFEVVVVNDYIIFIPNAFTPNGDGTNDSFRVFSKGVKNFSLTVFNRWGEKVFLSNNLAEGWDGTFKNERMNPGVFVYLVELEFLDGYTTLRKGSFVLVR